MYYNKTNTRKIGDLMRFVLLISFIYLLLFINIQNTKAKVKMAHKHKRMLGIEMNGTGKTLFGNFSAVRGERVREREGGTQKEARQNKTNQLVFTM